MDMGDKTPCDPQSGDHPDGDGAELALWERFLASETTAADEAQIRAWSGAPGSIDQVAERVRRAVWEIEAAADTPVAVDAPAMLARLRSRLSLEHRSSPVSVAAPAAPPQRLRRLAAAVWAAAAVVTVVALAHPGGIATRSIHLGLRDTGSYQTGPDERLDVRLSDGTEVSAAPNTSVRIVGPNDHRAVYVRGEAYVDATDDGMHPVIVHAANALVENAGARFAVRTDSDRREVRIAVATGVVLAGDSGAPWQSGRILTRGTLGLVSARGTTRAFRSSDPDDALVWEAGGPRFDPQRLRDALPVTRWKSG
jgi:transmembrane sensor